MILHFFFCSFAALKKAKMLVLLELKLKQYNRVEFITDDPISVPHRFTQNQDIEIAALFAALLAWGQRKTIINNANRLMDMMDGAPYAFIKNHQEVDRKRFTKFVHRTFQPDDLLYFIEFLQYHFAQHSSLENLFADGMAAGDEHIGNGLAHFHQQFFVLPHLKRTEKHLQTPLRKSACKRINLFLKWMVRKDSGGVDFGIWKKISPAQLLIPLDVHVHRIATELGLLQRKQSDWQACLELTARLRQFDATDPVKYDFALFGMGMERGKL
jgi:uncharacterized protein (TIGR02757 family)